MSDYYLNCVDYTMFDQEFNTSISEIIDTKSRENMTKWISKIFLCIKELSYRDIGIYFSPNGEDIDKNISTDYLYIDAIVRSIDKVPYIHPYEKCVIKDKVIVDQKNIFPIKMQMNPMPAIDTEKDLFAFFMFIVESIETYCSGYLEEYPDNKDCISSLHIYCVETDTNYIKYKNKETAATKARMGCQCADTAYLFNEQVIDTMSKNNKLMDLSDVVLLKRDNLDLPLFKDFYGGNPDSINELTKAITNLWVSNKYDKIMVNILYKLDKDEKYYLESKNLILGEDKKEDDYYHGLNFIWMNKIETSYYEDDSNSIIYAMDLAIRQITGKPILCYNVMILRNILYALIMQSLEILANTIEVYELEIDMKNDNVAFEVECFSQADGTLKIMELANKRILGGDDKKASDKYYELYEDVMNKYL